MLQQLSHSFANATFKTDSESTLAGVAIAAANDGSMRTIVVLMTVSGALMLLVRLMLVPAAPKDL